MSKGLYIRRFRAQHFGCIQDCELALTRLHALVGPNDSGKSTLLRALAVAQRLFHANAMLGGDRSSPALLELEWSDGISVHRRDAAIGQQPATVASWFDDSKKKLAEGLAGTFAIPELTLREGEPRILRLDPDAMRQPSELIPSRAGLAFGERGTGLAAVYDALLARKRRAFDAIEKQLIELFPRVESLVLLSVSNSQKQLAVQLKDGGVTVSGDQFSEGMLYFLAFAALPYLERTPLVLVEEPENGLHPARIAEVVRVLREVSKSMQIVLATHSPLVINELEGREVSIITRDEQGTHAVLLSETPGYEERSSVYKNGELWLGYSDGEQERPLLHGTPAP